MEPTTLSLLTQAVLQAGDLVTTCMGMEGGFQELNPLLSKLSCAQIGAAKIGLTTFNLVMLRKFGKRNPVVARRVLYVLNLLMAGVVMWNINQLTR